MKNILILLSFLLIFSLNLFGQNNWQIRSVCTTFNSAYFINNNTGWIVGASGYIIKTTDCGNTWYLQSNTSNVLNDIVFINELTGITGGANSISKTTNSGLVWYEVLQGMTINSIQFINSLIGYSACNNGIVLKTTNSGSNWSIYNTGFNSNIKSVFFQNEQTGFASYSSGNSSSILKTSNGGLNWISVCTDTFNFGSIYFVNLSTGYTTANKGYIFKTTNSGNNWFQLQVNTPNHTFLKFCFINPSTGWLNSNGGVFKTTNSGENWSYISGGDRFTFFTNENTGWTYYSTLFYSGIAKSTNGGLSWNDNLMGFATNLSSIAFKDSVNGWAVGYYGAIRTTNNGKSWIFPNIYDSYCWRKIIFQNQFTGWMVGGIDGGPQGMANFSITTNGGTNWSFIYNDQYYNYSDIINIDDFSFMTAWYCSYSAPGRILVSSHLGPFSVYYNINNTPLSAITGTSLNNLWAVGFNGHIVKSTNSGFNWYQQNSPSQQWHKSIDFIDSLRGWIVGDSGNILNTINGGNTWLIQFHYQGYRFNSVKFLNQNTGWITGDNGSLFYTTNSGINWNSNIIYPSVNLNQIYIIDNKKAWVVGNGSLGLYTDNCGGLVEVNNISTTNPTKYNLLQNYPNPFNPTTRIKFDIPNSPTLYKGGQGGVSLKIYDIRGREIQTLVNEKLNPGTYEVTFDGSNIASGVYFYQLRSGEFVETKKFVLLK